MLNSGKKICALRDKKNIYSNSCIVRTFFFDTNWNSTNRSTNSYTALTFFNNVCQQGEKNTEKKLARRQLTVKEESSKGPTI
jgi:hypothetical protein